MFGVNQAIIVTRIAEMKEISIDEIKNALEESKSSKGKELYYIMCAQPMQPVVECTEAELQAYANSLIKKVEEATGIKYDERTKSAVVGFFIFDRKRNAESIDKVISYCLKVLDAHKDCVENTMEWFLMEDLKRQLMGIYAYDSTRIEDLKALINEVLKTEDAYNNYVVGL